MTQVPPIVISNEKTHWTRFDNSSFEANDNIGLGFSEGSSYRNVHDTQEVAKNKNLFGLGKDKVFFDPEWDVRKTEDLLKLSANPDDQVIVRRLGHIYPANQLRPPFFPKDSYNQPLIKVNDLNTVPHALHQIGLFSANHYKTIFLTKDFQASGLYHAIVNFNGRWETDVVDDFIPIYEKSGKPIWGMDLQQPWQLILMKFWAKRLHIQAKAFNLDPQTGGYIGILNAAPFKFVEVFTNSTWKFTNLSNDGENFLRNNVGRVHKGHFILKSKNSQSVNYQGLIKNQACYELVGLIEQGSKTSVSQVRGTSRVKESSVGKSQIGQEKKKNANKIYIATIRSINKNKWTGSRSVVEKDFKKSYVEALNQHKQSSKFIQDRTVYDQNSERFGIDRYFTIEGKDLLNLFSYCYVAPRRLGYQFYSNYFKFTYPANRKKAVYLEFDMPEAGFLDFSIKQSIANLVQASQKSQIKIQEQNKDQQSKDSKKNIERFLRCKYILLKDNKNSDKSQSQQQFQKQYNPLAYQTYEIEYMKGYNTGDAHFLRTVRGRYVLRIKSEKINKDAEYIINYTCQHDIKFKEYIPNIQVECTMLKDAMSSTIDKVERLNLRLKNDNQIIAYGNLFEYIGYGYVGAKLKKESKTSVIIDIDPKLLKSEGYLLKNKYKGETEPFAFVIKPGQATSVVLKKANSDKDITTSWPPKGIAVFEKNLN